MSSDQTPEEMWDSEPSPRVDRATFLRRMAMGWEPHRALHTALDGRYRRTARGKARHLLRDQLGGHNAELHEMLGRKRTIAQWSLSSGVAEHNIRYGIKRYGSLQKFFLNIGWYPGKPAKPMDLTDDLFD